MVDMRLGLLMFVSQGLSLPLGGLVVSLLSLALGDELCPRRGVSRVVAVPTAETSFVRC
jgi:hypothetical protein